MNEYGRHHLGEEASIKNLAYKARHSESKYYELNDWDPVLPTSEHPLLPQGKEKTIYRRITSLLTPKQWVLYAASLAAFAPIGLGVGMSVGGNSESSLPIKPGITTTDAPSPEPYLQSGIQTRTPVESKTPKTSSSPTPRESSLPIKTPPAAPEFSPTPSESPKPEPTPTPTSPNEIGQTPPPTPSVT